MPAADPVVFSNAFVAWSTSTGTVATVQIRGIKSVELPISKAELANSVMGDVAATFFPGIASVPITVNQRQDFTTGGAALGAFGADKEAWFRLNPGGANVKFRVKVRPVNAAVSSTNPSYMFSACALFGYNPVKGSHGQLLESTLKIGLLSGCAITRSTTT